MLDIIRAHRFALRLKPREEQLVAKYAGQLRWVWNHALAEQIRRREAGEQFAFYEEMCRWLTQWRNAPETAWLSECPAQAQQYTLKCLHLAFMRFFDNCKKGLPPGYPKFKPRGRDPGIRCPSPKKFHVDWEAGKIFLPKVGWVRVRLSRKLDGELRNCTVVRDGQRWFVTIQEKVAGVLSSVDVRPSLGIDLGVAVFGATVDAEGATSLIPSLHARETQLKRLKRYQRAFRRKKKGSKNCAKAARKVAKLHRRIRDQRADWLHKLTTRLADQHPVVVVENLKTAQMTRSARGTAEKPGRCVQVKGTLNRTIRDQGWGIFTRLLAYKLAERGGQLVKVSPAHSSQTCRICGHVDPASRQKRESFCCTACGHVEHADVNAAGVILQRGIASWDESFAAGRQPAGGLPAAACGGDVSRPPARKRGRTAAPVKQENIEGQHPAFAPG